MLLAEELVEPLIKPMTVIVDAEPRVPKYKRNGDYHQWVCNHFPGMLPEDADDPDAPLQVVGEYQRFEYKPVELGNIQHVKQYLYTIGWMPDDWNYKRDPETGKLEKHSAKLSDSSLELLGEVGQKLITYYTLRSRKSIVEGWIAKCQNGRVHGKCMTIATPTHRARHSIIVNVPASHSLYGKEMRALFVAEPGFKIIGADSAGNQLRGLCHDLKNPEYTETVVNGDVHTANTNILKEMHPEANRGNGKKFIYAYLFGAGGGKLALDLTGVRNPTFGNKLKDLFATRVTGLKPLVAKLEAEFEDSLMRYGAGRISAIDGRPIYADSKRKALNYRLQSTEGITCKCAIMQFVRAMLRDYANVKWQPLIFMHDETQVMVPEECSATLAVIAKESFREGPKLVDVMIMDGDSKVGNNWCDTH
jgi:DNA polymerase-1